MSTGHSFFADNLGRFYPFDEDDVHLKIQKHSLPRDFLLLRLLQEGVADLGIVITRKREKRNSCNDQMPQAVRLTYISRLHKTLQLVIQVLDYDLLFEWQSDEITEPFHTLTASTAQGEIFGYCVLGVQGIWNTLPTNFVWSGVAADQDIKVQRTRVMCPERRQLTHVIAWNQARTRSETDCENIIWPVGTEQSPNYLWRQPDDALITITDSDVVFKEGYNSHIAFDETVNRISVNAVAGAGMGVVGEEIKRGAVEEFPYVMSGNRRVNLSRYDGATSYDAAISRIGAATGPIVTIRTSKHFRVDVDSKLSPNTVTISLLSTGSVQGCDQVK